MTVSGPFLPVIPAHAGIQSFSVIPASVTAKDGGNTGNAWSNF
jgi:hypothetical protein